MGKKIPRHVAVIMDGNGRWARQRRLPRTEGHRAGIKAVRKTIEQAVRRGVEVLTLFAFSSENWRRPKAEVQTLLQLFQQALTREVPELKENGIRLRVIGDQSRLPISLQKTIAHAEEETKQGDRLTLVIAASYGGRWDLLQATRQIAEQVAAGVLQLDQISEALLQQHLALAEFPEPDLFIRTGGEQRISNFLLWHLAYTELYFTETLWPDFDEEEFDRALEAFAQRERRFGHTSEQLLERARAGGRA